MGRPLKFKSLARVHITLVKMMCGRFEVDCTKPAGRAAQLIFFLLVCAFVA